MLKYAVLMIVWHMNGKHRERVNHARMTFRSIEDARAVAALYPQDRHAAYNGEVTANPGDLFTTSLLQVHVAGNWVNCGDDWQLKRMVEEIQEALDAIHQPRTKPAKPAKTLADIRQANEAIGLDTAD